MLCLSGIVPVSSSKEVQAMIKVFMVILPHILVHQNCRSVVKTKLLLSALHISTSTVGEEFLNSIRVLIADVCIAAKPFSECEAQPLLLLKQAIPDKISNLENISIYATVKDKINAIKPIIDYITGGTTSGEGRRVITNSLEKALLQPRPRSSHRKNILRDSDL